jgi:DNA-directed RNA polymerase subunit M/transcription elongation factor TFIIS|tara:strand:+ start:26 stop:550 length:525 start_codon:yes stop_codon:yes gene_type:complete
MNSNIVDEYRNNIVSKLNKYIESEKYSRIIEKSVYNHSIEISKKKNIDRTWNNEIFKELYLSKVRSIYSNLNKDSYIKNTKFLTRIKNDKIDLKNIATLSVYDIFPENWKYMLELKSKRDKLKYELKPEAMTDAFKCRKCGSRSTSYYEVQTRSADEPMTQFITCLDCNKRWKQ